MSKFITQFEQATKLLIDMFCAKQDVEMEYAVGDDITGVLCISDCYFNLSDIYMDMKEDKPKGLIFEWYHHCVDHHTDRDMDFRISYASYCMGARYNVVLYRLTSDHIIYYKGQSVLLKKNEVFKLAGIELSSFGNNSPFHYEDDIIRLPNAILTKV